MVENEKTFLVRSLVSGVAIINDLLSQAAIDGLHVEIDQIDMTSSEHKARMMKLKMLITEVLHEG